jgi:hypothetical protein
MNDTRRVAFLALAVLATTSVGLSQYYPRMGKAQPGAVGDEPLATFTGAVQDIDKKILRIKSEDANTLQFVCGRKTQYFDGDKKIKSTDVKPGDHVSVETKRFRNGELEAVNVRLQHAKTENAEAPKTP